MIHAAWQLFLLLGALTGALLVALWATRQPKVVLLPLAAVIVMTPKTGPTPVATVAGISVRPMDLVITIALIAALLGIGRVASALHGRQVTGLILLAIFGLSLARGMAQFGVTTAYLGGIHFLDVIALGSFILAARDPSAMARTLIRWVMATAACISAVAVFRAATQGLGDANQLTLVNGDWVTSRVIVSDQAVFVAAAAVLAFATWARRRDLRYGLAFVSLTSVVLISQHRSVWIALAVGMLFVLPRVPAARVVKAAAIAAWLSLLLVPLLLTAQGDGLRATIADSLSTVSLTTGTGGARTGGASVLIHQQLDSGGSALLIGKPMGAPWDRVVNGRLVTFQPHDFYVESFVRIGAVGLVAILILFASAYRTQRRRGQPVAAVVILVAVYCLAYSFPASMAPLLALALVWRTEGSPPDVRDSVGRETKIPIAIGV